MVPPEDLHVVWVLATSLEEPLPAGVSTAQSGLVVPLYHLVSEPLGLQFSRLFLTHGQLIRSRRGERRVLGAGEETGKSSLLSAQAPPSQVGQVL